MALDWTHVVTLVGGWALSQLGSYLESKRAVASASTLSRENRLFEIGRDAYKAGMAAVDVGHDVVLGRLELNTPEKVDEVYTKFFNPILDARIAFGLPVTSEVKKEIFNVIFMVSTTHAKGADLEKMRNSAVESLNRQREEIIGAWRRVLHGPSDSESEGGKRK